MSRLQVLVSGELARLKKYNLFAALFVTLLFWVGIAWFINGEELQLFVPLIFLVDSTVMTVLLVGVTMFYEKQEHTLNSIMVSPVTENEYLLAKVIINLFNSFFTVLFLGAVLYFMKQVTLNYLVLVPAVLIVTVVHTLIGIWLSYHAKSFSSVLFNLMAYMFLFLTPSIFVMLGLFPASAANFLILMPPEASKILIEAAVHKVDPWKMWVGFSYLITLSFLIYRFLVKPAFNDYLMRETGV